jgi:hypothetical protein
VRFRAVGFIEVLMIHRSDESLLNTSEDAATRLRTSFEVGRRVRLRRPANLRIQSPLGQKPHHAANC